MAKAGKTTIVPGTVGGGPEGGGPTGFSGADWFPPVCLLSRVSSGLGEGVGGAALTGLGPGAAACKEVEVTTTCGLFWLALGGVGPFWAAPAVGPLPGLAGAPSPLGSLPSLSLFWFWKFYNIMVSLQNLC